LRLRLQSLQHFSNDLRRFVRQTGDGFLAAQPFEDALQAFAERGVFRRRAGLLQRLRDLIRRLPGRRVAFCAGDDEVEELLK